ncbi:uncharacterized protein [Rutidosis leptorrhynchoides]|uniref:uncharacterized protein n=1 Tax=Rutidosis leptorrhynchoides TaxID=125765 RepID=UPI003A99B1FA
MALLGDDGRGYELARKLESQGIWRSWLGDDSLYSNFVPFLSSPSAWESFMRADESKSRAQIQLQIRARALLFDKACVSLLPRPNRTSTSSNSMFNPNYLQLHGDDIYYTLENPTAPSSKVQSKASFGVGSRYGAHEDDTLSQRIPESWYTQFFEKYRAVKPYRLPSGHRESEKRTPEQMSNYLRIVEKHKRSRSVFMEEQNLGSNNPMFEHGARVSSNLDVDENLFFPETMFAANSVPDSALPLSYKIENVQIVKCNGVLDNLPPIMTKSPIMLERLGIRPDYLSMEQGNHDRRRNGSLGMKNNLGSEQAAEMSRKVVSRLLLDVGFDSATDGPLDIYGQLFGNHISKLGRILKILSDSYKKEYSAIELLKMFLQTIGHGNLAGFAEVVKDSTKNHVQPTQLQQVQAMQSQMQLQNQTGVRQPHQFQRQLHNQMINPLQQQQQQQLQQQQMLNPLQQQQQWDRMRRRQPATPRGVMNMGGNMNMDNNDSQSQRSMVEVKLENPPEFPMDNNTGFSTINYRTPQMQFRQQQFAALSAYQSQSNNQFRPMASAQIPQLQPQAHSPNMGLVRAPPVKVEAFQELMGGDSSMKPDEPKMTSPN